MAPTGHLQRVEGADHGAPRAAAQPRGRRQRQRRREPSAAAAHLRHPALELHAQGDRECVSKVTESVCPR
eukprot:3018353-Pyramimonas_sp.AAC.1